MILGTEDSPFKDFLAGVSTSSSTTLVKDIEGSGGTTNPLNLAKERLCLAVLISLEGELVRSTSLSRLLFLEGNSEALPRNEGDLRASRAAAMLESCSALCLPSEVRKGELLSLLILALRSVLRTTPYTVSIEGLACRTSILALLSSEIVSPKD
jgi:hypothetical protein